MYKVNNPKSVRYFRTSID